MATILADNLKGRFAELVSWRERNWPPAQLAGNARTRQTLVDRFDPAAIAQPGDRLPDVSVTTSDGESLRLTDLTANGPAVLLFFRFAGCPACNIALRYYEEQLVPALRERGVPLLALSPQRADRLGEIKEKQSLSFPVASDADNELARRLGIAFAPDERPSPPPRGWIGEVTGTGTWELPQPTALIIGPTQVIRWLKVSPDWLDRPEADEILAALDQL